MQTARTGVIASSMVNSSPTDADALAYIAAAGITDTTQKSAANTLFIDLKAAGVYTKMTAFYPMLGGNAFSHKFNAKDPRDLDAAYRLSFVGGWTHSDRGALPNGTTAYANTFFAPLTQSMATNSFTLFSYNRNGDTGTSRCYIGASGGAGVTDNFTVLGLLSAGTKEAGTIAGLSDGSQYAPSTANAVFNGLKLITCSGDRGARYYKNGVFVTDANTQTKSFDAYPLYVGALNNYNTSVSAYSNQEIALLGIATGLSATEVTALYTAVQKFQTTLKRQISSVTTVDADALAFVTAAAITDQAQATAVDNLVIDLKAASIWTKMKAIYPFVGGNANAHKFNLKDPRDLNVAYRLQFNGGWTHSNTGALPNGTNGYADTYYNAFSNIINTSSHLSVYNTTANAIGTSRIYMGAISALNSFTALMWGSGGTKEVGTIGGLGADYSGDLSAFAGHKIINTNGSRSARYFKDGIFQQSVLQTSNIPNINIYIGAANEEDNILPPSPNFFQNVNLAFASIGDGLTDADCLALYTAVQKYQTALGRYVTIPAVSDTDAQAFINAAVITDWNQATAVNQLVTDLKVANVWTKMKAVYPFVGGTATTHKFNLKDPRDLDAAYRLVFSGGWTHSSTGALPNGTTGYADTFLTPSTALTNYSSHLSFYSRTNRAFRNAVAMGSYQGASTYNNFDIRLRGGGRGGQDYTVSAQYDGFSSLDYAEYVTTSSNYYVIGSRTASNVNKVFENGVLKNGNSVVSTRSLPNVRTLIGASSTGVSSVSYYDVLECAFATIGDGLTDTEALALYNAVQKYQMILGRQMV